MLLNARLARRGVVRAIGTGAVAGAMLFFAAPSALADLPPSCTAGDVAQVRANVSAGTSAYLFTHPWVNDFFTGLTGLPRDQIRTQIQDYMAANPQEQAELQSIRQPLTDLRNRCGTGTNAPAPLTGDDAG
jgi:hemophore-related protein